MVPMEVMEVIECDVLVVGGGVAAASAVRHALDNDLQVCMAVKGRFGVVGQRGAGASSCGTTFLGTPRLPGIHSANFDPQDLFNRIITAGLGMADQRLVGVLVKGIQRIHDKARKWGVVWGKRGPVSLGYPIISATEHLIRSSGNVQVLENTMIIDLVVHGGTCAGAVGVTEAGTILLFKAPAVILATGGNAQLFQHNVHPDCVTGDGYAMVFRAGATLMNMEFMQIFFCTPYPTRNLLHVWHAEELGNIYNREGHRFLPDYLPPGISVQECIEENLRHAPFSTRDRASRYLAIAIVKEVQSGRGSPHGGVYFNLPEPRGENDRAQEEFFQYRGIDRSAGPIELTMGHQCSNGGISIDSEGMTSIPGVFAAGEVTTGMHGTDRLGGNMLANCLIFGGIAGESASRWAWKHPSTVDITLAAKEKLEQLRSLSSQTGKTSPGELLKALQRSAWNNALLIRSEKSLRQFLEDIEALRTEYQHSLRIREPMDLSRALELKNLLLVGEIVGKAARQRRESRGGHYREDYSERDTSAPPKVILLNQDEAGSVNIQEKVIDPEWKEASGDLGKERWG